MSIEGTWGKKTVNGVTYVRYSKTYDGKKKDFYGKTKTEVMDKVRHYEKTVVKVINSSWQKETFYDYAKDWLFSYKSRKIKEKTVDFYETIIENYIRDTAIGNAQLLFINRSLPRKIREMFQQSLYDVANKHSSSTVNGLFTTLLQINKWGLDNDDFAFDLMQGVEKPLEKEVAVKKKELHSLDYSEVQRLHSEMSRKNTAEFRINGKPGSYVYGICAYAAMFSGYTGLRFGELTSLEWKDIKYIDNRAFVYINKQYVRVRSRESDIYKTHAITSTPKSESSNRYVPLCDEAMDILTQVTERFGSDRRLIFSSTDKPIHNGNLNKTLKAMCVRQGLPPITCHILRHSFASILLNEDQKSLYNVSAILGHSSPDVTYKKYIDIFEKEKIKTVDLFKNIKK